MCRDSTRDNPELVREQLLELIQHSYIKDTLCFQFYELYHNYLSKYDNYQLEFFPANPDINRSDPYLVVEEDEPNHKSCQIIWFKKSLLKMFLESHAFFAETNMQDQSNKYHPLELYIMSLGFLLVTPQNHTYIQKHEKYMIQVHREIPSFIDVDYSIVGMLLSSKNNKLNKSSTMWVYYKKLTVILSSELGKSRSIDAQFPAIFMKSAGNHVSNYYCWNTIRWIFDFQTDLSNKLNIYHYVFQFCKKNYTDSSSWSALTYILRQSCEKQRCFQNYNETERLRGKYKLPHVEKSEIWLDHTLIEETSLEIIKSIDLLQIGSQPAFDCLLGLMTIITNSHNINEKIDQWRHQVIQTDKFQQTTSRNDLMLQKKYEYTREIENFIRKLDTINSRPQTYVK